MILLCICFENKIQLAPIIGAVIAAIIVVIGWFIISYLNRKNEIAKELRGYRLKMLTNIIDFRLSFIKNNGFNDEVQKLYDKAYTEIQLYGKNDEIKNFEKFVKTLKDLKKENNEHLLNILKESLIELSYSCQNNIRKELKLEKLNG